MTDHALLSSMVAVDCAWLGALSSAGSAPGCADVNIAVTEQDCERLAVAAEAGGNPVIGLVDLMRERAQPSVAPWLHRGFTSQDVLDTDAGHTRGSR